MKVPARGIGGWHARLLVGEAAARDACSAPALAASAGGCRAGFGAPSPALTRARMAG
ncbi:hypothetical protein [Aromatoleum diolicum]|uniref:Uncharacterized protein n=1 Tax=Aromatoleum diolicum TaxID=75796 RepID=A0ABX1QFI2_9RHOO|nr:hypothetical protein [Aromatoleum diolicum]NMG77182.1 hypothetical protein [Aromatoleum diolicum]